MLKEGKAVIHLNVQDLCGKNSMACLASFVSFLDNACPCNLLMERNIALKLHAEIPFDFGLYSEVICLCLQTHLFQKQKMTEAFFHCVLPVEVS